MATTVGTTEVSAAGLPNWYDQLSTQFGNVVSQGVTNASNLPTNWYSGARVAGQDPLQTSAITGAGAASGQWMPEYTNAGQTYDAATGQVQNASTFNPNQVQQFMNPYLQGAQQSTINLSNQNLFENVIPNVNSTFAGTGQFGSSRNADFMNRAISNQQRDLTNSLGALNYGAQKEAFDNQHRWGQLGVQGGQILGGLGQLQQGLGTATATNTWQDLNNMYGFGEKDQNYQQKLLDTGYEDWQSKLTTPINIMGALSQIMPRLSQPYANNRTTISAPTGTDTTTLDYILSAIMGGLGAQPAPAP